MNASWSHEVPYIGSMSAALARSIDNTCSSPHSQPPMQEQLTCCIGRHVWAWHAKRIL